MDFLLRKLLYKQSHTHDHTWQMTTRERAEFHALRKQIAAAHPKCEFRSEPEVGVHPEIQKRRPHAICHRLAFTHIIHGRPHEKPVYRLISAVHMHAEPGRKKSVEIFGHEHILIKGVGIKVKSV